MLFNTNSHILAVACPSGLNVPAVALVQFESVQIPCMSVQDSPKSKEAHGVLLVHS